MMLLHLSYNEIILMQMKYFIFRIYDLIYSIEIAYVCLWNKVSNFLDN